MTWADPALKRIVTTGFARGSNREVKLWDSTNMEKPLKTITIDGGSDYYDDYDDDDVDVDGPPPPPPFPLINVHVYILYASSLPRYSRSPLRRRHTCDLPRRKGRHVSQNGRRNRRGGSFGIFDKFFFFCVFLFLLLFLFLSFFIVFFLAIQCCHSSSTLYYYSN